MADAFKVGDLVWAKMKSYPYWPARITDPPDHIKPPNSKKGKHCVCFFGTNDFGWIPEDCIVRHSEDMANSTKNKTKTSAGLLKAIKEITDFSKGNVDNGTSMDSESENDASSEKSPTSPKRFGKKITKKREKKKIIFDQFSSTESIPSLVERENDADVLLSSDNSQGIQEQILSKEKEPKVKNKGNLSFAKSSSNESITASLEEGNSKDLFPSTLLDNEKESKSDNEAKEKCDSMVNGSATSSETENEKNEEIKKSSIKKTIKRKTSLGEKRKNFGPFEKTDNGPPKRHFYECPPTPAMEMSKSKFLLAKEIKVTDKKIGFLGINIISAGVLKNLVLSGHNVTVYDEKHENCQPFVEAGASTAETADDVVASCDITFGYLADINAVKCLMYSNFGILKGLEGCAKGSKGYVEMTPIDVATALEFEKAFSFYGQQFMIAPVVGSRQNADEGSLLTLPAGDVELFTHSYSCLQAFSRNVFYVSGEVETGCKMYSIQSMLIGTTTAALAEAMALIQKCGLSFDSFYKLIEMGEFSCQLAIEKSGLMNTRNFLPNSDLNHQLLDMKMALKMANSYHQSTVVSAAATELFKRAKMLSYCDHDVSSVVMGTEIELENSDDSLDSD